MKQAWIHLQCPACQEVWESTLEAVPILDSEFECPYCRTRDSVSAFVKTKEGLKVLREFQS